MPVLILDEVSKVSRHKFTSSCATKLIVFVRIKIWKRSTIKIRR